MSRLYIFSLLLMVSCTTSYDPNDSIDEKEERKIIEKIAPYLIRLPKGANLASRFNPEYKMYYQERSKNFYLTQFHQHENGYNYFYVIRDDKPTLFPKYRVGVCGRFKWINGDSLSEMREYFVTPLFEEEKVLTSGETIFPIVVKTDSVGEYYGNFEYVDFPSKYFRYNRKKQSWETTSPIPL